MQNFHINLITVGKSEGLNVPRLSDEICIMYFVVISLGLLLNDSKIVL